MRTIDYIEDLRKKFIRISKEQEKSIIEHFGENISNEYTEQDIWEQTRKIINKN